MIKGGARGGGEGERAAGCVLLRSKACLRMEGGSPRTIAGEETELFFLARLAYLEVFAPSAGTRFPSTRVGNKYFTSICMAPRAASNVTQAAVMRYHLGSKRQTMRSFHLSNNLGYFLCPNFVRCVSRFLFSVVSSQAPAGVCERFKITNSNKIPCTVKFVISPAAGPGDSEPPPPAEKVKSQMLQCSNVSVAVSRIERVPMNPKNILDFCSIIIL